MSSILSIQNLEPLGVERVGPGIEKANSTCSYMYCGSTVSCNDVSGCQLDTYPR
jgi:hypothetical protein